MIQWLKNFFGMGIAGHNHSPAPPPPPAPARIKKTALQSKNYYRRNGKFYSSLDDGLIEDVLLLLAIQELFDDGDIHEYADTVEETDITEDLLDVDVSDTPVFAVESIPTPEPSHWNEPAPVRQESYSSGYSDSGCSSSDSDSGGGDD